MDDGKPSNVLQFTDTRMSEEEHRLIRTYYFGGCGDGQGFWPERHRWGPWQNRGRFRERMCLTCSLMSDRDWLSEQEDSPDA